MRLHFREVSDGELWVYNDADTEGAFPSSGPDGDGDFWTGVVRGDTVIIEFRSNRKYKSSPLQLPEISHLWQVLDPKPFVGDPGYDATQHLFNCVARLRSDPDGTICRIADLLGVDSERVRLWTFARAASEPRDDWSAGEAIALARAIAP